jgi:hypothetical protein
MSVRSSVAFVLAAGVVALPLFASAQSLVNTLALFNSLLNALIGILITIAIVIFFWGLIKYMMTMGTEDAHKAVHLMLWGVVSIFVMVSIWGIIQLLQSTFNVSRTTAIVPGGVPFNPNIR